MIEGEARMQEVCLYVGDVRTVNFKPKSFGTIATDPPFGVGAKGTVIRRDGGKYGKAKPIDTTIAPWDIRAPHWSEYIPKFWDWLDDNGILILFHEKLTVLEIASWWERMGGTVRHIAVWCIPNAAPQARKVKWKNSTNFILIATKNKGGGHAYHWENGQGADYFVHPTVPGTRRVKNLVGETHPTEKPVKVFTDWLLKWWGDREKPILDPFCGSGSILVAAKQLGFRYIVGGDINPLWVVCARERLLRCGCEPSRAGGAHSTVSYGGDF